MSRNGAAADFPSLTIRMRPACSTTKSRPLSSAADVTSTGDERPSPTTEVVSSTPAGSKRLAAAELGEASGDVPADVVAVEAAADAEVPAVPVAAGASLPGLAPPAADAGERNAEGLELAPGEQAAIRTSTAQMLVRRSRRSGRRVVWPERGTMAACYRLPSNASVGNGPAMSPLLLCCRWTPGS